MDTKFSIHILYSVHYEYIAAEIQYDDQILCLITQEDGIDKMQIEFFNDQRILSEDPTLKFLLSDFLATIEKAKKQLIKSREKAL